MIAGIGLDIVALPRLAKMLAAYPRRLPQKLLCENERLDFLRAAKPCEFLAGRIAAKEALAKALGIGIAAPMGWHGAAVVSGGKPVFVFGDKLARYVAGRKMTCHLTISHDAGFAAAAVIAEVME